MIYLKSITVFPSPSGQFILVSMAYETHCSRNQWLSRCCPQTPVGLWHLPRCQITFVMTPRCHLPFALLSHVRWQVGAVVGGLCTQQAWTLNSTGHCFPHHHVHVLLKKEVIKCTAFIKLQPLRMYLSRARRRCARSPCAALRLAGVSWKRGASVCLWAAPSHSERTGRQTPLGQVWASGISFPEMKKASLTLQGQQLHCC